MNDYCKLMEQIGVPKELESRVLSAARRQAAPRTASKRSGRLLRGAVCAACALALVLGTVHLAPREGAALEYTFGLTAYAAETGETVLPNANGALALTSGTGIASEEAGHYTGCLFQVTGEGIETVSLSVDRGGLYRSETRTGLTDEEVRRLFQQQERGELVCDVYGEDEDSPMNAEVMTALGASVTEHFDPEVRYGFWVPEYEADPDEDLKQAAWDSIDTFDGAKLTVTVTFADGREQSKTYTLSTGRLRVEYSEDGRRTMLPQLAGDKESFVYGIYAASETESRWLRWPVQDSRTVSLGNPYGTVNGRTHSGIDIPAVQGAVILAAADGTVTEVGIDAERGNYLVLDHGDGLETVYAACRDVTVEEGDTVKAGGMIAAVGSTGMSTGPHLHFEVRENGKYVNPWGYLR